MTIKNDVWIRRMAKEHDMIEPFEPGQVREIRTRLPSPRHGKAVVDVLREEVRKVISYGVSSYGYDLRVADEFRVFSPVRGTIVDPKNLDDQVLVDVSDQVKKDGYCLIPPNSFALARSIERFKIPRDVLTLCLGKSSYARCGIVVNVTPFEPEWEGWPTLEISNTTGAFAKIYANEGLAQVIFLGADEVCECSYADRKGKYQDQPEAIVPPRM